MPAAFRIDLQQRRSLGQILGTTAQLYSRYPLLFAVLALGVIGPFELVILAITGHGPLYKGSGGLEATVLVSLTRSVLITPLISALHVHAVVAVGEGKRARLAAVAGHGFKVLPVVAAADIVSSLGIFLGFLALLIPGLILSLRWAVAPQAAALERGGWIDALRSSARLTSGNYMHVFGLLVVVGVLTTLAGLAVRSIWLGSTSGAPSVAAGIVLYSVLASLSALTLALLYFDLRVPRGASDRAAREYRHLRDLD